MDEILENFCNLITPSVQTCEEVTENTEKLVHLLKRKSNYPVNRWKIIGGFDSKTFIVSRVELVIYVNNNNQAKGSVLTDWMDVLLLNSEAQEEDLKKTDCSLSFPFKEIPFNVFVAVEYDKNLRNQQKIVVNYIQQGNNPIQRSNYLEGELCEARDDFINGQPEFTKDIVRLANYWNNSILWDKNTPERSVVFELLAIGTAKEELEKTAFPHHKKTFVKFLQKVQNLRSQTTVFEEYYTALDVPLNIRNQRPLVLDPVNPTNNVCRDIGLEFYNMFSKCATTTLQMFDSGCENMQQLFFPQPMLWKLLKTKSFLSEPRNYLIEIKFYSSKMKKSIIRLRPDEVIKGLVHNMLNVLSTHVKNIETKKPDISVEEVQKEGKKLINRMKNDDEDREWMSTTETHEDRAVTVIVPLIGKDKGLFLSFDV